MFRVFACLFIILFQVSYAKPVPPASKMPQKMKIYVAPENIVLDGREIYILLESGWVKTPAIFTDSNGYYVDGRVTYSWGGSKEDQGFSASARGGVADDKGNYAEIEVEQHENGEGSVSIQGGYESENDQRD